MRVHGDFMVFKHVGRRGETPRRSTTLEAVGRGCRVRFIHFRVLGIAGRLDQDVEMNGSSAFGLNLHGIARTFEHRRENMIIAIFLRELCELHRRQDVQRRLNQVSDCVMIHLLPHSSKAAILASVLLTPLGFCKNWDSRFCCLGGWMLTFTSVGAISVAASLMTLSVVNSFPQAL